jgi:hypothetical protein
MAWSNASMVGSALLLQTRVDSRADSGEDFAELSQAYNHHFPQQANGPNACSGTQNEWQHRRPELLVKRVYEIAP